MCLSSFRNIVYQRLCVNCQWIRHNLTKCTFVEVFARWRSRQMHGKFLSISFVECLIQLHGWIGKNNVALYRKLDLITAASYFALLWPTNTENWKNVLSGKGPCDHKYLCSVIDWFIIEYNLFHRMSTKSTRRSLQLSDSKTDLVPVWHPFQIPEGQKIKSRTEKKHQNSVSIIFVLGVVPRQIKSASGGSRSSNIWHFSQTFPFGLCRDVALHRFVIPCPCHHSQTLLLLRLRSDMKGGILANASQHLACLWCHSGDRRHLGILGDLVFHHHMPRSDSKCKDQLSALTVLLAISAVVLKL